MANLRLLLLIPLCLILIPFKGPDTSITFIDVGQGDGIYIDAGEDILIDCGSSSTKKIGKYTLEPFLKSQRIGHIDKLFVTHADSDHTNGLTWLAQESSITVGSLYLPACAREDENYDDIKEISEDIHYLSAGDAVKLTRGQLTCMSPAAGSIPSDMNAQSLVLLFTLDDFSALFMGDADKASELMMLDSISDGRLPGIDELTLLKVGHHGSSTSTSEELIKATSPLISILSYGEGNRYGHPSEETLQLLDRYHIRSLRTASSGAITITTDGCDRISISIEIASSMPYNN